MKKNALNNHGFTLVECLLALYFYAFILIIIYQMLCLMNQFEYHSSDIQDINGLLQLKQYLNLGSNIEISINEINYDYKDKCFKISLVNDNIIIQPGTNILILNVDSLEFIEEEGYLFIEYQRDNKLYRRKIYG
ncbi:MAG: hypothetical protein PHP11_00145 [Erysipelotrichaceae bacterium]|nr:hypothetical protein [Erysipelotrichaceae bacterium]MDD3923498.1 hypothetical protein [Erysipelotrichaceae bacterium]